MSTPILICDDSGFARRQMARSIPDSWEVEISFAGNGQEALEVIRAGKGDVVFLDLNMPVMDGYETMEAIRKEDLPCLVIVVSGDVQAQARERMLALGAIDFIRKPIDNEKLTNILSSYGIYSGVSTAVQREAVARDTDASSLEDKLDAYREMVNIAMGRAGESLAQLMGEFVDLPIPNVNLLESNELSMAIAEINRNDCVSAVSKGFVSAGIRGEALVIFNDINSQNIVELLKYDAHQSTGSLELEALMDVSNILIGACLNGLSEQLNVSFSHTLPVLLGRHQGLAALLNDNVKKWGKVMAIEIGYAIKARDIAFDLLLLFPDEAMNHIYGRLVDVDKEAS
ncbi:MAG: chemotaxis protein CheY-P-specific phosphatase CheC [Alteromonadaceae bacterium]|uniref:Response regulator n=1 Tax=Alteromonas naphthalenivorans TaxID=715451 RepID=F5Z520_ALTNA|nr:response regulator [Alteromonas naphthalenivorans]AEF04587.1 response regulator [Alteromonas naphthalenivorans]MBB66031.1 response regulator [Rickettsiales bacterium]